MSGITLNRYTLTIPSCPYLLDVESFDGLEQISELYHYTIKFTTLHPDLTAGKGKIIYVRPRLNKKRWEPYIPEQEESGKAVSLKTEKVIKQNCTNN